MEYKLKQERETLKCFPCPNGVGRRYHYQAWPLRNLTKERRSNIDKWRNKIVEGLKGEEVPSANPNEKKKKRIKQGFRIKRLMKNHIHERT